MKSGIHFFKYQGTGNDFIMVDNRDRTFDPDDYELIQSMCDRRFGVGADGLILLKNHARYDFEMLYFNADGYEGSMCGNGGRCIVAFAQYLGIINSFTTFMATDGLHEARVVKKQVELKMANVEYIEKGEDYFFLDTGSPHYVKFIENLSGFDVFSEGQKVRYSERFKEVGTNVNFVQVLDQGIRVATYERGVENETLSCGTGIVASSIAHFIGAKTDGNFELSVRAKGGVLKVHFKKEKDNFFDIWLCGPAEMVFKGHFFNKEISKL